jgi:hypothetical protein
VFGFTIGFVPLKSTIGPDENGSLGLPCTISSGNSVLVKRKNRIVAKTTRRTEIAAI